MEYERICIIMNKSQMERETINDQAISVMRYLSVVFIPEILFRSVEHKDKAKNYLWQFCHELEVFVESWLVVTKKDH